MRHQKEMLKRTIEKRIPSRALEYLQFLHISIHARIHKKENLIPSYIHGSRIAGGKKYYILQISTKQAGILTAYTLMRPEIARMKKKGYIAVIDYENPSSISGGKAGRDNVWEEIFEQPCGVSVCQALKQNNVIIKRAYTYHVNRFKILEEYRPEYYQNMKRLYENIFTLKKELKEEFETYFTNMFSGKRVLGAALRELFRIMHKNNTGWSDAHPDEPDIDEIIRIIRAKMDAYHCEYIFVATEFEDSIHALAREFGSKLLYTERMRKKMTQDYVQDVIKVQDNCLDAEFEKILYRDAGGRKKQKNMEYVKEIYGLSKCTSLLGTPSGGFGAALIWNGGKYEQASFFGEQFLNKNSGYF